MQYYVKAIYAGAVAFLTGLGVAVAESGVTFQEGIAIALATVLAVGGILGLQAAPAKYSTSTR